MMKLLRGVGAALALCLASNAPAQLSAQTPVQDVDPALWVVKDRDTTIYLFGTIHVLKPGVRWLQGPMRRAFAASDQLVLEIIAPSRDEYIGVRHMLATDRDHGLPTRVSPATLARVHAMFKDRGLNPEAADWYETWYTAILVLQMGLRDTGYRPELGVEYVLTVQAGKESKKIAAMETLADQYGYFDRLSPATQEALLTRALDILPRTKARTDAVTEAWADGDAPRLAQMLNEELAGSPELEEALVKARNGRWADWIKARMDKPGTVFFAVGAGHLAGPDSLQVELAKRGLKVERVPD